MFLYAVSSGKLQTLQVSSHRTRLHIRARGACQLTKMVDTSLSGGVRIRKVLLASSVRVSSRLCGLSFSFPLS